MDIEENLYVIIIIIAAVICCFNMGCMVTETKNENMLCTILSTDDKTYNQCRHQSKEYIYADLMYKLNVKESCK